MEFSRPKEARQDIPNGDCQVVQMHRTDSVFYRLQRQHGQRVRVRKTKVTTSMARYKIAAICSGVKWYIGIKTE